MRRPKSMTWQLQSRQDTLDTGLLVGIVKKVGQL